MAEVWETACESPERTLEILIGGVSRKKKPVVTVQRCDVRQALGDGADAMLALEKKPKGKASMQYVQLPRKPFLEALQAALKAA